MANGESNGYVTNDVTWLWMVKSWPQYQTFNGLKPNISTTAGDANARLQRYELIPVQPAVSGRLLVSLY